jgi:ATP-dependent DNA helicase RecG
MNSEELVRRIANGEDLHTEFKLEAVHPDELSAAIVGFANAQGGELIIGVSNDRRIVGVGDTDRLAQHIDNVAFNNSRPPISTVLEIVKHEQLPVMVVHVPKGDQRPYSTNRGTYFIRTPSGRRQATREELLRLFQATESMFYDETPLIRLDLSWIDMDAVNRFVTDTSRSAIVADLPPERLLRAWRLVHDGHPTIAGLLLFGRSPQDHLPYAQVNAARIPGTDVSYDPSDRKDLGGRLLDVLDQSMRFLNLHLLTPHRIRGLEPEPQPELPAEALREALVNALAHRDYTIRGPIRLFVFDDRVEFHSPGRAPNTVDEEAMRAGTHVVRNPHIYARLSDAGLVTGAGTGIPRMVRLVRQATNMDVQIAVRDYEVLLTVPRRLKRE